MAQYTFDTLKDLELAGISLPSGYQRVEWLQATGTQYINTGLRIGANDVEYNFKWRETSAEVRTSLCGNDSPWSGVLYHPSEGTIYAAVGNSDGQGARTIPINSWIAAKFTAKNGAWSFRTNETTLSGSYSGTVISSNYNFFLFCNSGVQEFSKYSQMPFFDLKVGGVLLRSFVACRGTSDSVAGMYDIANGVFYPNAGTGTFSIGGDVAPITPIAGDTCTITDLGITLTSNGTDWYVTNNITLATLSQATQLFSFAKGNNGVTATITDLGITLTSDGTDWYVTSNITIPTLSQATQLFSFAKSNAGVTVTVTSTGGVYKYEGDDWQLWYTIIPPLVFKGMSFEQTDYWQKPEMVFRGISFEGENILRYYGVKIDVNGVEERNYIPCIRTSDGIAGMYDTVNGVFYASAGTNNFTK